MGRKISEVIGIGIDVMFFYTPEGLAIFRMELEAYLNEKGLLNWVRGRNERRGS